MPGSSSTCSTTLPSSRMKRSCASVGAAFGLSSRTHVSNGGTVEPSARYHVLPVCRAPARRVSVVPEIHRSLDVHRQFGGDDRRELGIGHARRWRAASCANWARAAGRTASADRRATRRGSGPRSASGSGSAGRSRRRTAAACCPRRSTSAATRAAAAAGRESRRRRVDRAPATTCPASATGCPGADCRPRARRSGCPRRSPRRCW